MNERVIMLQAIVDVAQGHLQEWLGNNPELAKYLKENKCSRHDFHYALGEALDNVWLEDPFLDFSGDYNI